MLWNKYEQRLIEPNMWRKIRQLNADDLLLLYYLGQGNSVTNCAKKLCLTQPAASQRLAKITKLYDKKIYMIISRKLVLTHDGRELCRIATEALLTIMAAFPDTLS